MSALKKTFRRQRSPHLVVRPVEAAISCARGSDPVSGLMRVTVRQFPPPVPLELIVVAWREIAAEREMIHTAARADNNLAVLFVFVFTMSLVLV